MNPQDQEPRTLPAPAAAIYFRPRLEALAREHLRDACNSRQRNPAHWLDQGAPFAIYAYETLTGGLPRDPESGRPMASPDFADQQQPAATAAVKAFAREISADPDWLSRLERLLPDRDPRRPFGWHAIQTLPRPPE